MIGLIKKLGNMPPNVLTPKRLASHFEVILDGPNLVGIKAVGGVDGVLGHTQLGLGDDRPIALIGKGITFDSGGISAKPNRNMHLMKFDMLGAATILAVGKAVNKNVDLWGCIAENTPRNNGVRPGDVLTYVNGTRVEVIDTDAEGRLVLADGIIQARKRNPKLIITVATLTGCARAVEPATVVFSNDTRLLTDFLECAAVENELTCPFPIFEDHREAIKGDKGISEIKNWADHRAGCSIAAAFLEHFVGEVPWIHLDIAGSATREGKPTGAMYKTLKRFLEEKA